MSLLGYSLMTVLHELLFSFENICNLYNLLLKNYDTSSTYMKQAQLHFKLVIMTRGKIEKIKCVWFISRITHISKPSENL